MFTGLISNLGSILSIVRSNADVWQIKVQSSLFVDAKIGDSISINGCCLTIINVENEIATFTLMQETLRRTTFSQKSATEKVHVERSATLSDIVDGHPISGHVSGVIILQKKEVCSDGSVILTFRLPNVSSYLTYKGCVAIDGVSLTVSNLMTDSFSVSLIPHTQKVTLLMEGNVGSAYNVEFPNNTMIPLPEYPDLMGLALKKSLLGRITAPSNPWVGCVITDELGNIVSTGYHRKRGEKHAEVDALSKLSEINLVPCSNKRDLDGNKIKSLHNDKMENYTLYCTLEPCNHTGLQPPCTRAILNSGIRKVVVGILDPDTRVAGSGIAFLRLNGVEVTVLHDERVTKSLTPYITHRQTKRPYVTAKMAISLDGKIAPSKGSSQFPISNPLSREHAHTLRLKSQAILVGTRTAQLDEPRLDVRLPVTSKYYTASQEHRPLRCFLDLTGKVRQGPLLDTTIAPTLVFTNTNTCSKEALTLWQEKSVQIVLVSVFNNKIALTDVLDELGKRGVLSLLVEGGAELFTSFVENNLVDRMVIYIAPILLGNNGVPLFTGGTPITDRYRQEKTKTKGDNTVITYVKI